MTLVNVLHSTKPIEVEDKIYALNKGDKTCIPDKLARAMIKRGWAAKIPKPELLGEVEGTEVKDVSKWVKGITDKQISKLKIGKKGFAVTFMDAAHVVAGKVYTPFSRSVNSDIKEAGFSCARLDNIFGTFKKGEKAQLWWKGGDKQKLLVKEAKGNLSWRHNLPTLEEAAETPNLKGIPVAAIKMDITDIRMLATLNKGKRVADKYNYVAFQYSCKKVTVYAIHEEKYTHKTEVVKLKEVEAIEGEGKGIAIYSLGYIEKVLKGSKSGSVRIEEGVHLKVAIRIGRESKAVTFVAFVEGKKLREKIAEAAAAEGCAIEIEKGRAINTPSISTTKSKEDKGYMAATGGEPEKLNKEEEAEWTLIKEGTVENRQVSEYAQGVKLEQTGSFYRIVVGDTARGYITEAEAVKRYEWLTGVW